MGGLTACSDDSSTTSGSSDTVNVVASTALWADVVHDIAGDNDHDAHGHDGDAHGHESEDPHDHDADDHADNDSDLPTNPHSTLR